MIRFLVNRINRIYKGVVYRYRVYRAENPGREQEIKYWRKAGIDKGCGVYGAYLKKFSVDPASLRDKVVADFGCGPLGGMLSVLDVQQGYPIDILADEYNEWGKSKFKIYKFDGKCTNLQPGIVDVFFCCNAIDHTWYPKHIIREIQRVLKKGGLLFLHVHLREKEALNVPHPISWTENFFENIFSDSFRVEWRRVEDSDEVNNGILQTLYAKLVKI
jgi:SAM-dependent methyltransferase